MYGIYEYNDVSILSVPSFQFNRVNSIIFGGKRCGLTLSWLAYMRPRTIRKRIYVNVMVLTAHSHCQFGRQAFPTGLGLVVYLYRTVYVHLSIRWHDGLMLTMLVMLATMMMMMTSSFGSFIFQTIVFAITMRK